MTNFITHTICEYARIQIFLFVKKICTNIQTTKTLNLSMVKLLLFWLHSIGEGGLNLGLLSSNSLLERPENIN